MKPTQTLSLFKVFSTSLVLMILILMILVVLPACSQKGSGRKSNFSFLDKTDTFFQIKKEPVDFIWVVDNSNSMQSHQEKLKQNFMSFFREFKNYDYDFQMGVITTDAYVHLHHLSFYPSLLTQLGISNDKEALQYIHENKLLFRSGPGKKAILTQETPQLQDRFMENIMVGTQGFANEKGMESLLAILNSPQGSSFLRPDAHLGIIVISDEEDSSLKEYPQRRENDYVFKKGEVQAYVKHFIEALTDIKGSQDAFSISAVITDTEECRNKLIQDYNGITKINIGSLYRELALKSSGAVQSLCDSDFKRVMKKTAHFIMSLSHYLVLSRDPDPSTLQVFVNGTERKQGKEWFYKSSKKAIFFYPEFIPQSEDRIDIIYMPATLKI